MLTQVQSSLPEAFNFRRYPKYRTQPVCEPYRSQCVWCLLFFLKQGALKKIKSALWKHFCNKEKHNLALFFIPCGPTILSVTLQESREFPFSKHDNKQALMDVTIFGSVSMSTFRKLWKGLIHNRATVWQEITSVNVCFLFFTGSGTEEEPKPSQTAQLPLLPVPRGGQQRLQGEQRGPVGLQSWFHRQAGDGQCARQRQALPP